MAAAALRVGAGDQPDPAAPAQAAPPHHPGRGRGWPGPADRWRRGRRGDPTSNSGSASNAAAPAPEDKPEPEGEAESCPRPRGRPSWPTAEAGTARRWPLTGPGRPHPTTPEPISTALGPEWRPRVRGHARPGRQQGPVERRRAGLGRRGQHLLHRSSRAAHRELPDPAHAVEHLPAPVRAAPARLPGPGRPAAIRCGRTGPRPAPAGPGRWRPRWRSAPAPGRARSPRRCRG
jgi:hypothetical protein